MDGNTTIQNLKEFDIFYCAIHKVQPDIHFFPMFQRHELVKEGTG
jgi:hypothetical protein